MTIVVGVDGSEGSLEALRWAVGEAGRCGTGLRAVHVWRYPYLASAPDPSIGHPYFLPTVDPDELREAAAAELAEAVVRAGGTGAPVEQRVVEGDAAEALIRAAGDAELLVVGSRGRGGFAGLLLGSVSQACAQHARRPVVIVRNAEEKAGLTTIVAGVDGSENSKRALAWAAEEAHRCGAELRIVHAWAPPPNVWRTLTPLHSFLARRWRRDVEAMVAALVEETTSEEPRIEIRSSVVEGAPAEALLEAAADADLLVVGSRGLGGFSGLLLGSVSQQCAHHASCPVAIVPPSSP